MAYTVALSGDAIINKRVRGCDREEFGRFVEVFRTADVSYTHLETVVHEHRGRDVFPAAEAGGTWMQSPEFVPEELRWTGIDVVSHASNHALDYAYGGLRSTWESLRRSELAFAGTGRNLSSAGAPTYLETANRRVALISMTTAFTRWSRAGPAGKGMRGRPGINPLGFRYEIGPEMTERIEEVARELGWWVTKADGSELTVSPPGLHNTTYTFALSAEPGVTTVPFPPDRDRNLRSIRDAANRADIVLTHIHSHAFRPDAGLHVPADFVHSFARECVDAGADVVISQGSHAPLRGIELYRESPIFYDPGELFIMSDDVDRLPVEFYLEQSRQSETSVREAVPSEALERRRASIFEPVNPPDGYHSGSVVGNVVPVCEFGRNDDVTGVRLYPGGWFEATKGLSGIPKRVTGDDAAAVIEYVDDLSGRYDTSISYDAEEEVGVVEIR